MDRLQQILKDSNYGLGLFSQAEIDALAARIFETESRGKTVFKVRCLGRGKDILLKPEEVVRQLYLARLMDEYGYERRFIKVEHTIHIGRSRKRADIVVMDKKPKLSDGREQLDSYCNATGAPMGVWTNGEQITHYHRKDPNYIDPIDDIPIATMTLRELLDKPFTLRELLIEDRLMNDRLSLKQIILEMEDTVLANAGVDVFEEVFKLIFIKLYDEYKSRRDKERITDYMWDKLGAPGSYDYPTMQATLKAWEPTGRPLRSMVFRESGLSSGQLATQLQDLFNEAKESWRGIFPRDSKIALTPSHLSRCVAYLQSVKLFNSNLQVVDEAFEYLVNKSAKGDKGQYFTPRHVIDMCAAIPILRFK
jgi:type I restriction enzyme M protein